MFNIISDYVGTSSLITVEAEGYHFYTQHIDLRAGRLPSVLQLEAVPPTPTLVPTPEPPAPTVVSISEPEEPKPTSPPTAGEGGTRPDVELGPRPTTIPVPAGGMPLTSLHLNMPQAARGDQWPVTLLISFVVGFAIVKLLDSRWGGLFGGILLLIMILILSMLLMGFILSIISPPAVLAP